MYFLHEELTRAILGVCFEVSNELGAGFLESVYQEALKIALADKNLHAISQAKLDVRFRGQMIGQFFADFLVEDRVILEIKAVQSLEKIHLAQVINYLVSAGDISH